MTKGLKIWLWFALVLSVATTAMNAAYGRGLSVLLALGAMAGLCILLFARKRWGFLVLCGFYVLAFAEGIWQGISGQSGMLAAIVMSFIGSALIPGITYLFLRKSTL